MFDMGFIELAVIAGIGLLVLGPERLPVAARTVGRYVGQARRFVGNFQRQIEQEVRLEELNKTIMRESEGQSFTNNDGSVTTPEQNDPNREAQAQKPDGTGSGRAAADRNTGPSAEASQGEGRRGTGE